MKISISSLNKLNRWESFQYLENASAHIDKYTEGMSELLIATVAKFNTSLEAFDTAMVQERKLAPVSLTEAEEARDYAVRKIYSVLREYSDYRFDKDKEIAANALLEVFVPYGTGSVIAAMAQEVETAHLSNLIQDLTEKEGMLDHLATLQLEGAISSLKANNNQFKESQNALLSKQAQAISGVVKLTRAETEKGYIAFIDTVNALAIVEGPEKYVVLKNDLNALHQKFQARAKQRTKKKEDIITEPSNN